ncbi:hypothetical protein [Rubrobacter marinus]|uniref:hypothetical protein n=1 Tax=Rubrobacter marinus TaxID=2653852 RepID=UPI00140B8FF2|nr:hypothetical protein [Rubrobacter marinus]
MNGNGSAPEAYGRKSRPTPRLRLAALAVFVLALAASCGGASEGGGQAAEESAGGGAPAREDQGALGREPLGEADAPVVLTEYADYQ